ncbi:hypothetical protein NE237_031370 [Protea cynaroides]|uniref:Uncharacterized protein n=1 Tax=Protea cynaroides TaxID=273540 RepID=A0A9Q0R232_9MAGN|nr:hypothetical protein NE237_031370 [Protea cynaroides]
MAWACSYCPFINPQSHRLTCQICLSSSSSSPSIPPLTWSCNAFTFPTHLTIQGAKFLIRGFGFSGQDDELGSSVGSTFLPLQPYKRKNQDTVEIGDSFSKEVTPYIYDIFQHTSQLVESYTCLIPNEMANRRPYFCMLLGKLRIKSFGCKPFRNSIMGRKLCVAEIEVGMGKPFVLATSHLESSCPVPPKWDQMYSKERVAQANEALNLLKDTPNVIFFGDMNWDDKLNGEFPLLEGWVDAWVES